MTKVHTLKSGKTFTAPSLFVNPRSHLDATALWQTDTEYGLHNIDGILINMIDYKLVYENMKFNYQPLVPSDRPTIRDKIKLFDPSLHSLLTGTNDEKEKMLASGLFDDKVKKAIKDMMKSTKGLSNVEKTKMMIEQVYRYLRVKPLIDYQVKHDADMIIATCVNLSSQKYFLEQLTKARQMLEDSRTLLETSSLRGYMETRDLMNSVTISSTLIKEKYFHDLSRLLLHNNPDHVGIRIMGIDESNTVHLPIIFQFLREFALFSKHTIGKIIPIHLLNVDELGYASYCSGVSNIVSPIATSPYYAYPSKEKQRSREQDEDAMFGSYYHPRDMNSPKINSLQRLPCNCRECSKFEFRSKIPDAYLPIFRRVHWLNIKDGEIEQLRTTPARLDRALRDKLGNSMRTQLVAYIPDNPVFAI